MRFTPLVPRPTLTDPRALARAVRSGDPDALGTLYDLHAPALFTTVARFLGSRADAEDVVHDVFVGLPEALRAYDEQGRLEAWLARVAIRRAMMHRRSALRRREDDMDAASMVASPPDRDTDHGDLLAAVQRLPDTLRHVVILRQVEGFSHQEIAGLLGITAGNSRIRLARALEALRRLLRPDQQ